MGKTAKYLPVAACLALLLGQTTSRTIHAQAPHAELRTYAPELRSLTKGLGYFTMDVMGYEEVPTHEAQKVLQQRMVME